VNLEAMRKECLRQIIHFGSLPRPQTLTEYNDRIALARRLISASDKIVGMYIEAIRSTHDKASRHSA
jgi:hypothetical protein